MTTAHNGVIIHATYHEFSMAAKDGQGAFVPADPELPPIKLPARVTPKSYIVQYGGVDREAMERGEGHTRKILPRFTRRGIYSGEPRKKWREFYGRLPRKFIQFQLA